MSSQKFFSSSSDTLIWDFTKFRTHSLLPSSTSQFPFMVKQHVPSGWYWHLAFRKVRDDSVYKTFYKWNSKGSLCSSYLFFLPPPLVGKRSHRWLLLPPQSRDCLIWESGSCICWSHWRHFRFWWPHFHGWVRLGRILCLLPPESS